MVGVNYGELGFLTEIMPTELIQTLENILASKVRIGERSLLSGEVWRGKECVYSQNALNDVVVEKGSRERLLGINLAVGGEEVMNIRADGIIFSTPTGSTAYSLSAGGSIVYPSLRALLVTPICPHSLTSRPLVLPLDGDEITLHIPKFAGDIFISFDGQISDKVLSGDVVRIKRAGHTVRYVQSPTRSYYGILRQKLNWGIGNRRD
jgi:NAD+ kinase